MKKREAIPLPAETHQHGSHPATSGEVLDLLLISLGSHAPTCPSETTLEELGLTGEDDVWELWDCVCEEFAERSLGPELDPSVWPMSITLEQLAVIMASTLAGSDSSSDEVLR